MSCGALSYRDDGKGVYFDGEGQLICTSCGGYEDSTYCDNCGERFNSEDGVWVEDEYLCPDCFEDQCFEDEWTHEYHYINDAIQTKVYVTPNNGEPQWYDVGLLWVPHLEELIKDEKLANNLRNMSSVKLKASQFNKDGMYYYNETKRRLERWNSWRF